MSATIAVTVLEDGTSTPLAGVDVEATLLPSPGIARVPTILVYGGGPSNDLTDATAAQMAGIFDVIRENITASIMSTMRTTNPDIIVLFYRLPGGVQSGTQYPDSYYVKDASTGQHIVNANGWHLLDFSQAVVRQARRDDIAGNVESLGYDGYETDMAQPLWRWTQNFGSSFWRSGSSTGPTATFPAGWVGIGGLWATTYMLTWHDEMSTDARVSAKTRLMDGPPTTAAKYTTDVATRMAQYLAKTSGVTQETCFSRDGGMPSETDWKYILDRMKAILDGGQIADMWPMYPTSGVSPPINSWCRFVFGSYLLVADGQNAWFMLLSPNASKQGRWRPEFQALIDVDYGLPDTSVNGGAYQTFAATPSGNIYKRTFLKYRVWVNPSATDTRTADGKTIPARDAVFEAS